MLKSLGNLCLGICPLCQCTSPLGDFCKTCSHDILLPDASPYRCPSCQLALPSERQCPNCHEHQLSLSHIYYAFDYVPPLDRLVLQFKNAQQPHLANLFAKLITHKLKQENVSFPSALLIPIPSSHKQFRKRRYNPATLFAKSLTKKLQCPLDLTLLRRHESAQLQKSLSRHDRFLHSSRLYYVHRRLSHAHVILVDDILTTGSTLESAARALFSAGASQVDAIVIARTANPF